MIIKIGKIDYVRGYVDGVREIRVAPWLLRSFLHDVELLQRLWLTVSWYYLPWPRTMGSSWVRIHRGPQQRYRRSFTDSQRVTPKIQSYRYTCSTCSCVLCQVRLQVYWQAIHCMSVTIHAFTLIASLRAASTIIPDQFSQMKIFFLNLKLYFYDCPEKFL